MGIDQSIAEEDDEDSNIKYEENCVQEINVN